MNTKIKKRVVVVLGMHRSGTSAITFGLKVLGVELGNRLMPPIKGNNDKGFGEDIDLNAINIELLQHFGLDWDAWQSSDSLDLERHDLAELRLRAVGLLRNRMDGITVFGMKDPRIARLLPFWRKIFEHLDVEVGYVIALRHPMSVARSLKARDGFEPEKSYWLWLEHIVPSVLESAGSPRVVVEYDRLLDQPEVEMHRIAEALNMEFDPAAPAFDAFARGFLEEGLRHTRFHLEDLRLDPAVPVDVIEACELLEKVAGDALSIDSPDVHRAFSQMRHRITEISPILCYATRLDTQVIGLGRTTAARDAQIAAFGEAVAERDGRLIALSEAVAERDGRLVVLDEAVAERDGRLIALSEAVAERDGQLVVLDEAVAERDGRLIALSEAVAERDGRLIALHQVVSERDGQIDALNRAVSERGRQIAQLKQAAAQRDDRIASLNSAVVERDTEIEELSQAASEHRNELVRLTEELATANGRIFALLQSTSWRVTGPLRFVKRIFSKSRPPEILHPPTLTEPALVSVEPVSREPFDEDFYLMQYPDVAKAGIDPYTHYINYGKTEGRSSVPPAMEYFGDFASLEPTKAVVLVVSHEASRTEAPVLSLNIVRELSKRYHVITLLLGGGALIDDFRETSAIVVGPVVHNWNMAPVSHAVDQLLRKVDIEFAIVNSVDSRLALPELARKFVPTVALIHEFAAYTRPRQHLWDALFWTSEAVFSTKIVWENAVEECREFGARPALVIPQGRSVVASDSGSSSASAAESVLLEEVFRPSGWPHDTVVVLGAGTVQLRKGVDLFIACATLVAQSLRDIPCRFVWIGHGYDPELDHTYSVYLADQVKRAGLQDRFAFVNEVSRIDVAYQHADILLLSSRLDPLPHVAVDAMSIGLPVVCFDKTTGIAALLTDHGLGDACVAPYLDIPGLASRVLNLVNDPDSRERIGKKLMELSSQLFNMSHYVENIEKIAMAKTAGAALEKEDCVTIGSAAVLDRDFILPSWSWRRTEDVVRLYVRSWASGIYLRKPFAGFHPGMYLEQHGVGNFGRNPLADYLLAGKPAGPWLFEVIHPASAALKTRESMRTALHLHIFYPDLARDIVQRLVTNTVRPDLLISVPSQNTGDEVIAVLREFGCEVADMQVVPNRGRDIGPLLTTFGKTLIHNYDLVGHLHSKKTATFNDSSIGDTWLVFLLENLLGGQHAMADKIISHMASECSLGLVFPDDPYVMGWAGDGTLAASLAESLGLGELPKVHFNFPVGTMFWARTEALRPLVELDLGWDDYPSEPLPYNGTMLHALERLLPFVAAKAGYRSAVTQVPGITR